MISGAFLDPLMRPFISGSPALTLFLISLVLSFLSILAYKYTTNQKELKKLREKTAKIQKRMKELQKDFKKKESQKEINKLNMEMMLLSGQQMKHSMKSTLITLIPFLLIFAWLGAHYAYQPLYPNQPFNVTLISPKNITAITLSAVPKNVSLIASQVSVSSNKGGIVYSKIFTLKAPSEKYSLIFKRGNSTLVTKDIIITSKSEYSKPEETYKDKDLTIKVSNKPLRINLLGIKMSWFWYYFIIMLVFSSLFRKLLKVY